MDYVIQKVKDNKLRIMKLIEKIMLIIFVLVIIIFQNNHTLWLDELDWSIGIVDGKGLTDIYKIVLQTGENLPLFYIILYVVKNVFGYNEFVLIFCTSTIFGIIGIYGVIKIAKENSDKAFVKLMNDKVIELGLKNTNFVNATGLDAENHYSTAYDMAMMARELIRHDKILEFSSIYQDYLRKNTDNSFWLVNTNKVVYKNYYSEKLL